MKLILVLAFYLILYVENAFCQDVYGCGGFIQSDVPIKFERVEVKLYTKQGAFKTKTECAPNNGYFLAAVYDKGDYVLKINPPEGWGFSPQEIELKIDGTNDPCSKGEDINFKFTGFTVDGSIVSNGKDIGPVGIVVTLNSKDKTISETETTENGVYQFKDVLPGDYIIKASHPTWVLKNTEMDLRVSDDNVKLTEKFTVAGYDVKGHVLSSGEPIQGVKFLVYSSEVTKENVKNCDEIPSSVLSVVKLESTEKSLCMVNSQEDGSFLFPSLPSGSYVLVPFYSAQNILFDIVPSKLAFSVNLKSVVMKTPFQVYGFSVQGKILDNSRNGVEGAKVAITSGSGVMREAVTASNGEYLLENVTTGHYNFMISKEKYYFLEELIHITPNLATVKDIFVNEYSVCGSVHIKQMPNGVRQLHQLKVLLQPEGQKNTNIKTTTLDKNGNFCFQSKPGKFKIEVPVIEDEVKLGLLLNPSHLEVEVSNKPLEDLKFNQFLSQVSGSIECIDDCEDVAVFIMPAEKASTDKIFGKVEGGGKNLKFVVSDVLPGKYKVTPQRKKWCWSPQSLEIEIKDQNLENVQLKHSGYYLKCTISHNITLNFALENSKEEVGKFELKKGENQFCLRKPGVYILNPISCYQFEQESYIYKTSEPMTLSLNVAAYKVEIDVHTAINVSDLQVQVKDISSDKLQMITPQITKSDEKGTTYHALYWGQISSTLEFTPQSKEVLFSPTAKTITVAGNCPGGRVQFEGHEGIFIEGKISPPFADVQVHIQVKKSAESEAREYDILTDVEGSYRVGPMTRDTEYEVSANKDGYHISPDSNIKGNFIARKLGQISVTVSDETGNLMSGVFLSLSGKQYRNNNFTKTDGGFHFPNLNPGQYFLKPMQKEFDFTPSSKMIDVSEGADVVENIQGKRVAFSCSGTVALLAGIPAENVVIEAIGIHKCSEYQESTVSDTEGNFRIRGLHPGCSYNIRLSKSDEKNKDVERLAPENQVIQVSTGDITNVHFLVFMKPQKLIVTAYVDTDTKNLHTLKALLYDEDNLDDPIHTINLNVLKFIQFPALPPKTYVIKMISTLSSRTHDIISTTATVKPGDGLKKKHAKLKFEAKEKKVDMEPTQSVITLPLAIAFIFLAYNYDAVLAFLVKANVFFQNINNSRDGGEPDNQDGMDSDYIPSSSSAAGKLARRKKR